jgi:uncharacterized circularly permuted ATP-grasp superfamily protein/uncharacterized alpha-E superfamily protein
MLENYRCPAGHYDEIRDGSGALREHWAAFVGHAASAGPVDFDRERRRLAGQLHDSGVTYNVHAEGGARTWLVDLLPHIVPAREWEELARGLRQRALLFELVVRDLYGAQQLLSDGLIPPALALQHPGFLRQVHGIRPVCDRFLHVIAFDVARAPDGGWRVVEVRTQAPSGSGYALENRLNISQLYPDAFREQRVCLLAPYFRTLRESLLEAAPCESGTPHIALLTPGPYSETYVEHAYLARYLGFTLVEGADLTVRDDRVYLKTVSGLRPVHGILRRLDDDFSDPLELRAESTIGVPGLVQAWRAGRVLLANALGTSVLESPALQPCLPVLCQALLHEPLALESADAVWNREPVDPDELDNLLARSVIKPGFPDTRGPTIIGPALTPDERRAWVERIRADPARFVLEEYVPLSQVPVWDKGHFGNRALMMRLFLVADGDGSYAVMNGGLARVGGDEHELVSGQRGGGSKDIWALSDGPVERVSLLRGRLRPEDIAGRERMVSSRAAEHLFWMGRYAERSEHGARILRAVLTRLHYGDPLVSPQSRSIVRTCAVHGLLGSGGVEPAEHEWLLPAFEQALIGALSDPVAFQGVAFNVEHTVRVAGAVRDRLSTDNWRELNRLVEMLRRTTRVTSLAEAVDLLDRVIMSLVAVGGLEMAHMTRDAGWRFMSLGRHLERVSSITATIREVALSESPEDPALLEWLLELSDSIITYRARYMGRAEWLAVADLLLFDPSNPRSAVFQLAKLSKHISLLPDGDLGGVVSALDRLSLMRTGAPVTDELFPKTDSLMTFIDSSEEIARHVSDALTLRYFSHVYELSHTLL